MDLVTERDEGGGGQKRAETRLLNSSVIRGAHAREQLYIGLPAAAKFDLQLVRSIEERRPTRVSVSLPRRTSLAPSELGKALRNGCQRELGSLVNPKYLALECGPGSSLRIRLKLYCLT